MTIEGGTAIVLTYVLVSMGVIIAFWLAALVIGWFIGRLRQHAANSAEKSNLPGSHPALASGGRDLGTPALALLHHRGRSCRLR
jgi:hypothetical protein